MPIIKLETAINAPIERVFDLSRCIDLHEATMTKHNERAVAGVTKGLINKGEMVKGAFARFDHDHFFERAEQVTLMKDVFDYDSPLWIFGKIADALFLRKYMMEILAERNRLIKEVAESNDWQKFIDQPNK